MNFFIKSDEHALEVLGLGPEDKDNLDKIKTAFRDRAKLLHPDVNPEAPKEDFERVQEAYEFLTNPAFRFKVLAELNKVPDVLINYEITFEEGFFGRESYLTLAFAAPEAAEGDGLSFPVDVIKLEIPPGTAEREFKFPAKGIQRGGQRSDVVVRVKQGQHPTYKMQGKHVAMVLTVPLNILLTGGEMEVKTLYGLRNLVIPPGTKPGDKLKVKNCGVRQQGHQYIEIEATFPETKELKEAPHWSGLKVKWELEKRAER